VLAPHPRHAIYLRELAAPPRSSRSSRAPRRSSSWSSEGPSPASTSG